MTMTQTTTQTHRVRIHHDPAGAQDPINDEGELGTRIFSFLTRHGNYADPTMLDEDTHKAMRDGRAFQLDYYEHGLCRWSLRGEGPQSQWDTSRGAGLLVLDESIPADRREKVARGLLEDFNNWSNGEVFYYVIERGTGCASCGYAKWERLSASPGAVRELVDGLESLDVRDLLPTVKVPTLVVSRRDALSGGCSGRYLAEHIPGAELLEQDGDEHIVWLGATVELVDAVREFLTGAPPTVEPDRELATVVITDIVGSTRQASELGDRRWGGVLDRHDRIVREELARFGGHEVKATGDGFVATFDGPARGIRCTVALRDRIAAELDLEIRAGIHTGEIERRGADIAGIGVHLSARIEATAAPGEVLVSRTVVDLVAGSKIEFTDRGTHDLDGVPGEWQLHAVTDAISGVTGVTIIGAVADEMCRRGIKDSRDYLKLALESLGVWRLTHVSIVLECGRPPIDPKVPELRESIAALLGLEIEDVCITATSGERLTDVGRGLGIYASAIVTAGADDD